MHKLIWYLASLLLLVSCIDEDVIDDVVPINLRITSQSLDTLGVGDDYQFEAMYTNNVGMEEEVVLNWSSKNTAVADIDASTGLASGISIGNTFIHVSYTEGSVTLEDSIEILVGTTTTLLADTLRGSFSGCYDIRGDFELTQEGNDVVIKLLSNYSHDGAAPGPYLYLSNNANSNSGAIEVGNVDATGSHTFTVNNVGLYDYQYLLVWCKPFKIKIGDGEIGE